MKKIGIIAGIGAAAGVHFYDLIVKACQAKGAVNDNDFPEILIHNISASGTSEKGITDDYEILLQLLSSVKFMNKCGVDVIAIACNTVHVHFGKLQENSEAEIINMIEVTADSVKDCKVVGILSSSTTKETKLYESALTKRSINVIRTSVSQQERIDALIGKAIAGKIGTDEKHELRYLAYEMKQQGAEKVILGCTELPLIEVPKDCVDAGAAMIERIVNG